MNKELLEKYSTAVFQRDMPTAYDCIEKGLDIEQQFFDWNPFPQFSPNDYTGFRFRTNCIMQAASFGNLELFNYIDCQLQTKYFSKTFFSKIKNSLFGNASSQTLYLKNFNIEQYNILHAAVQGCNLELVKIIVDKYPFYLNSFKTFKARINNTQKNYNLTPLALAIQHGNTEIVEYLIQKGAAISLKKVASQIGSQQYNLAPMYSAVLRDNLSMIRLLLNHGADVNEACDDDLLPSLHVAVRYGFKNVIKLLLESGANVQTSYCEAIKHYKKEETLKFDLTAFQLAVVQNDKEIVDIFLEYFKDDGVNRDADINLSQALSIAIFLNNKEMIRLLLKNGANPYKKPSEFCLCPIESTVFWTYREDKIIDVLYEETHFNIRAPMNIEYTWDKKNKKGEFKDEYTRNKYFEISDKLRVIRAVRIGDINELVNLCKIYDRRVYFDINEILEDGSTLLHEACTYGQLGAVQFLLNQNSDINAINQSCETPLMKAIHCGKTSQTIVRALLNHGANLGVPDIHNRNELMHAILANNINVFDLLLGTNAGPLNLNVIDRQGNTMLMLAVSSSSFDIFEKLIQMGSDTSIFNKNKEDALMFAARYNENKMAKLLFENGVSVDITNKENKSTFQISLENNNFDLCLSLVTAQILFLIANKQVCVENDESLKYLVKQSFGLDFRDKNQFSLLHIAIHSENSFFCDFLLKNGAIANEEDTEISENIDEEYKYNIDDIDNMMRDLSRQSLNETQRACVERIVNIWESNQIDLQEMHSLNNIAEKSYTPQRNMKRRPESQNANYSKRRKHR